MPVVYERCAGIDVHTQPVVVTVLCTSTAGKTRKTTRTFSTMTAELRALAAWLVQEQMEQVARESTGGYWWPVSNLLEERHQVPVVTPHPMQAVPGHKTEVQACSVAGRRGARHGVLRVSCIPPRPMRALRELTR